MPTSGYDAVIIGGGPGGATAATLLAKKGRKVLVLEKERFPRFMIGESLLPWSRRLYRDLGIEEEMDRRFIKKYGALFLKGGEPLQTTFEFAKAMDNPYPYAYHVPRDEHDKLLLDNARGCGAEVREGWMVEDVLFEAGRAVAVQARERRTDGTDGESVRIPATFVVDASGRSSVLAKKLRLRKPIRGMNKASVFSHYRGVKRLPGMHEGSPTIVTFRGGWFWIISFKGELTSVGAVMHQAYWREHHGLAPAELLDRAISESPEVMERLEHAERVMEVHSEGSFSYRATRFAGPGWVLCGDAAAFLDPVFSSGVYLSMVCAEEIANRIDRGLSSGDVSARIFDGYEKRMRDGMGTFFKFIYGFYDEAFYNMFLRPTKRFGVVAAIAGILAGNIHPGPKFRLRILAMDVVVFVARIVFRLRGAPPVDRARA